MAKKNVILMGRKISSHAIYSVSTKWKQRGGEMEKKENTMKIRTAYEKGSQTLSGCKLEAKDTDLSAVAHAIISLRKEKTGVISKIMESSLELE